MAAVRLRLPRGLIAACTVLLSLIVVSSARSQGPTGDLLSKATFVQKLDQQIPLDLLFTDSSGRAVRLGDYFGSRPIILTLGYFNCPNLCDLVRQGLFRSLQQISFSAGKEFDVIAVSIDPKETPALSAPEKAEFAVVYARPGGADGLHFLTGAQDSIQRLADAVGFEYAYDPAIQQFAHPSGIIILTPEGKVSRYFYGVEFLPQDVRLGLLDASESRIGSLIDQVVLRCYHYDPSTGKYGLAILSVLRAAGIVTVLALAAFVYRMSRHAKVS
jgi:protein SCO1